jgi:AI-2 transport protein TqsA
VINFVIQSVIQPKFVGDAVNLSLTLTFLSLVFWSFVIGPLGTVLAVPLTLLTKALLLDVDPQTRWMSALLSGGGPDPGQEPEKDEEHTPPGQAAGDDDSGPGKAPEFVPGTGASNERATGRVPPQPRPG